MNQESLKKLLEKVRSGSLPVDEALQEMRHLPFAELPFAKVDSHRGVRCGFPEVIFCQGKTPQQISQIARTILDHSDLLLATRAGPGDFEAIRGVAPEARYHDQARCVTVERGEKKPGAGMVLMISAGTSDIPVAEEARVTAEIMGARVETVYDAGVAGIHRLLHQTERIMAANVLVVVAGMEGALASVVGGLAEAPVIAVPTSVGYGASFGGLAPLLTMLNSCAAGVAAVNIDNGFGAGYLAALINRRREGKD
ncbi:MAG: nickel pincer cofactor biosynthesis protein LarB [Planctomycetes bacterium]|nr:nickel pincer cofactor biosynthesis protein LarB [Planctomycetota bacterium]